jgi:class 3 adenylate cyclase
MRFYTVWVKSSPFNFPTLIYGRSRNLSQRRSSSGLLTIPSPPSLAESERRLPLVFTDVRDFTTITESADPDMLMHQTSRYFSVLTEAFLAEGGTVDKFIGDAVMAFWNAPNPQPDHIERAYLRSLCDSISRSKLKNRNVELVLVEFPFQMSSERTWMMGMIVAELVNNAVRHAFDQRGGTIEVECRPSDEFVECRVSDNGSAPSVAVRPGSGLKIIEALAQELGASFQFNFGEGGSQAVLIIPVEQYRCGKQEAFRRVPESTANSARLSSRSY